MFQLCQYSDALGKPGQGAHGYRIFNIAIVDVILTFIGAWLIQKLLEWIFGRTYNYWYVLVGFFLLGILLHRIFCVRTTIDKLLFP